MYACLCPASSDLPKMETNASEVEAWDYIGNLFGHRHSMLQNAQVNPNVPQFQCMLRGGGIESANQINIRSL